jgi:hypothetical protein
VDAAIVHAIFAPRALGRIRFCRHSGIWFPCDTIPHSTNVIRTLPLLAAALKEWSKQ